MRRQLMMWRILRILSTCILASCQTSQTYAVRDRVRDAVSVERAQIERHNHVKGMIASSSGAVAENRASGELLGLSEVTGAMATNAAGYAVADAMVASRLDQQKRRRILLDAASRYGVQNWMIAAARMNQDLSFEELEAAAKKSGMSTSPFVYRR